jgi:[glutamine synthetase] adenylyltransferase / [glutamine synthetase]-adenylyl-L-tyrosine phosphorylase
VALLEEIHEQPEALSTPLFAASNELESSGPDPMLAYLAQSGVDRLVALSLFRQQFRHALFVANARELYRRRGVYETLAENSSAADKALEYALAIADAPSGFGVMALGRLGSSEFDLLSDADVLFVAEDSVGREEARKAAERIMDVLTAYTRDGTLLPVDARLRPRGREGELVTTPAQLEQYFATDAMAWEALTYLRLRYVAGNQTVADQAFQAARNGATSVASRPRFNRELAEMRRRLEESDTAPNLKSGAGGAYDIDYLVGRLQVQHGVWGHGNLSDRIRLIGQYGWLEDADARELAENAEFLRTLEHNIRLVTGRPGKWLPVAKHAQMWVAKLMAQTLGDEAGPSVDHALGRVVRRTREIYLKYPF